MTQGRGPPQVRSHSHDSRRRSRPGEAQRRPLSLRWQRAQARTAAQGRGARRRCRRGGRRRPRYPSSHPRRVVRMRGLSGSTRLLLWCVHRYGVSVARANGTLRRLCLASRPRRPCRPARHARRREETHPLSLTASHWPIAAILDAAALSAAAASLLSDPFSCVPDMNLKLLRGGQ